MEHASWTVPLINVNKHSQKNPSVDWRNLRRESFQTTDSYMVDQVNLTSVDNVNLTLRKTSFLNLWVEISKIKITHRVIYAHRAVQRGILRHLKGDFPRTFRAFLVSSDSNSLHLSLSMIHLVSLCLICVFYSIKIMKYFMKL